MSCHQLTPPVLQLVVMRAVRIQKIYLVEQALQLLVEDFFP